MLDIVTGEAREALLLCVRMRHDLMAAIKRMLPEPATNAAGPHASHSVLEPKIESKTRVGLRGTK